MSDNTSLVFIISIVFMCSASSILGGGLGYYYRDKLLEFKDQLIPPDEVVPSVLPEPPAKVVSIKITRPKTLSTTGDLHHLHLTEIYVFGKDDSKFTLKCHDPCTEPSGGEPSSPVENAFDGKETTDYHSKYTGLSYNDVIVKSDHFVHLIITGAKSYKDVSKIKIIHKHPAKSRFVGATVEILENDVSKLSTKITNESEVYELSVGS